MRKSPVTTLQITFLTFLFAACATQNAPQTNRAMTSGAPPTAARPVAETLHGVDVADPYRWLEDQNAPETRDWIARQNAYTDRLLGNRAEQARFASRIRELLNTERLTTPTFRNGRYFYMRRAAGEDLYSIYMRGANGKEERLIDPAPLSAEHTTSVGILDVVSDGKLLAYYVRRGGADETEVHFYDTDAHRDIGEPLPLARYYGVSIAPDNSIYFTRATAQGPRVMRRNVTGGNERELFGAGYGPEKIVYNGISDDGRWLLIHVLHGSAPKKTEIYLDDLRDAAEPKVVVNDLDFRSFADFAGDSLVIQTNWNAPNDRIMAVSSSAPGRENWREVVPENPNAAIQGLSLAGGRVFVRYLENVMPRIVGYGLDGVKKEDIAFETPGNLADISGTWSEPVAFFSFSSFHIPPTLYQYNVTSGQRTTFARVAAPVVPENFKLEQVWYPSKDGTRIPMFVMSRSDMQRNGSNPVYLTGYGGFTSSQLPFFWADAVAWVEQGGVFALPNLRGGGEFGEAWHQAGMLSKKQNVFDDFIAAAEYLVRERYTSPQHIGIVGTSNGGLLVAAAETQRPDLFGAVICRYPLIDMLRFHQFLVGSFWTPEYGSAANAEEFGWIYPYSPYQHVKEGTRYPATLFVTGDADTRVAPLHARKMTAMMQTRAANDAAHPILLRYHVSGGHSGGEPLNVQVKNAAEELGFLWWQTSRAR
ncbi:MAG: prolyl oligopeptidase family serine peptidase [Acidobacteriota bacterium]|nr:prolyl oligopeptidase family serine peptidase [Acidobacteriota bacterium]